MCGNSNPYLAESTKPPNGLSEKGMIKHTPGPWSTNKEAQWYDREAPFYEVFDESGLVTGLVKRWSDHEDESHSNARLIAAAPELLEALVQMLAIHDEPSGFVGKYGKSLDEAIAAQQHKIDARLTIARSVIAKATGGAV